MFKRFVNLAKNLLPSQHTEVQALANEDVGLNRVCLAYWHCHRQLHVDIQAHVVTSCPQHGRACEEFLLQLTLDTCVKLAGVQSAQDKLMVLLGSHRQEDWELLG